MFKKKMSFQDKLKQVEDSPIQTRRFLESCVKQLNKSEDLWWEKLANAKNPIQTQKCISHIHMITCINAHFKRNENVELIALLSIHL